MEWLWSIYWVLLLLNLILGVIVLFKKHVITGLLHIVLSIVLPIWAFVFALKRDWVGTGENEIVFLFRNATNGSIEAIGIIVGYGLLLGLMLYHIFVLYKDKIKK